LRLISSPEIAAQGPALTVVEATSHQGVPVTETLGVTKPHKTGLQPEAQRLLNRLKTRPSNLGKLFKAAKEYNDLEDALHHTLEYADYVGEDIDDLDASDVRSILDQIQASLLNYEQDPDLRQAAIANARLEIGAQEDDEQLMAIALLVDLVSFTWPQNNLLTMLTRSMAGSTFIDQTIVFDAPKWFARWLGQQFTPSGVEIKSVQAAVGDPNVLAAASELWQPLRSESPYHRVEDAIEAARQLI
jgi:hypothetical protein